MQLEVHWQFGGFQIGGWGLEVEGSMCGQVVILIPVSLESGHAVMLTCGHCEQRMPLKPHEFSASGDGRRGEDSDARGAGRGGGDGGVKSDA